MDKKSPFSAIEALVKTGRFDEAAVALKKQPSTGDQSWETLLWRGRIEEGQGRLDAAEKTYGEALRVNPAFNSLERELARFYENSGRPKEAEAHLLRALELGWPREEGEATLARVRGQSSVNSLGERGEFAEAAKVLDAQSPAARAEGDRRWPWVFSALLCERKYHEAFRLADSMLKKSPRLSNANVFLWPWWHGVSSRYSAKKIKFCAQEFKRLGKARAGGEFAGWFAYCRGVLLLGLGRSAEAMAEYETVKRLRAPSYAIMHHPFVMHRLLAGDFKWTISNCRALLKHTPDYWWFQCRMAEALMADGDVAEGLREFARAENGAADERAKQAIMTWHGAALLWAGQYRRSLAKLNASAKLGSRIWVNCWRGGVYVKLGKYAEALTDLNLAVKTDDEDLEAHLWRGEAYRLMGRPKRALPDLDRAIALDSQYTWAYFNRALLRDSMGDERGMTADFSMIPASIVAALRGKKRPSAGGLSRLEMRKVLEEGFRRAGGNRRPEHYLNALWMNQTL